MVKVLSLNVRYLQNERKRRILFKYGRDRADVVLFQETHSTKKLERIWCSEWGGKAAFSHGESNARGLCTLIKKGAPVDLIRTTTDNEGRVLITQLKSCNTVFTLINVYAPNKDDPSFFKKLNRYMCEECEHKILMGDFNIALDNDKDRYTPEGSIAIQTMLNLMRSSNKSWMSIC